MTLIHTRTLVRDDLTPVRAYAALRSASPGPIFLLESAVSGKRWGRYSILGYRPRKELQVHLGGAIDPLQELARQIPCAPAESESSEGAGEPLAARFAQSHVGVFFYDLVHDLAPVTPWPDASLGARLVGEATVVVFDHLAQTVQIAAHQPEDLDLVEEHLRAPALLHRLSVPDPQGVPEGVEVSINDAAYEGKVRRAKEYIAAGDIFQVQVARTFSAPRRNIDPLDAYRALRVLSASPYMFLLELPATAHAPALCVAGASPETLIRLEHGHVTLRPIAGTRRRGRTEDEDRALADELLADPKERAEHVMLIDLARNDVGRIATTGSVRLSRQMVVERFSHVMHLVSEVEGQLRPDLGPWDVLRAGFPAGTLTGAPKVRAMQIIRELETARRGVYGGAVGYIAKSGDMDLAIAIRTLVFQADRVEVTAAAGVVEGSEPRLEAMETRNKARAGLAAIAAAGQAVRL